MGAISTGRREFPAREWLEFQSARGLAANTLDAYGRDLDRYLGFLETENVPFHSVIRPTIGAYIRSITQLEVPRVSRKGMEARSPLANATLQQHLTVVRLFHDFLVEERVCTRNPLRPPIGWRGGFNGITGFRGENGGEIMASIR